jgi:cobalamin biosynthesis Co2+ chelatase CbiK
MKMKEIDEKYEALSRYIEAYDFKNLPTLMFSKEDAEYLLEACKKQIPKKAKRYSVVLNGNCGCPVCGNVGSLNYCSKCGQRLY